MKKKLKGGRFPAFIPGFLFLCLPAALHANNAVNEDDCPLVTPELDDSILLTREERIELMDQKLKEALSRVRDCRQSLRDANKKNNSSAAAGDVGADSSADGMATDADSAADNAENNANQLSGNNEQDSAKTEQNNAHNPRTAAPSNELSGTEMPSGADGQGKARESASAAPRAEQNNAQNPPAAVPSADLSGGEIPSFAGEPSETREPADAIPSGELAGTEMPEPDDTAAVGDSTGERPSVAKGDETILSNGKLPEDIPPANNDDVIARQIREAALAESDTQKQARLWNEYRRYKGMPAK